MNKSSLLHSPIKAINLGLAAFADDLRQNGIDVVHVDWRPPAQGDSATNRLLTQFAIHSDVVASANATALERMLGAHPIFVDVGTALETIPGFTDNTILHAGPPITWDRMCGPMQGAIIGALILEGRATDEHEARLVAASGEYKFAPCHEYDAVGPMSGIISPHMPVIVIEDKHTKRRAYSNLNGEGKGKKALSFGAYGPEVQEIQLWLQDVLAPFLKAAVHAAGGIDLKAIMARALHMGDEVHNRHAAATSLMVREFFPLLAKIELKSDDLFRIGKFLYYNDFFFLNFSMAACKLMTVMAHGVPHSTLVTLMSRNGVETGIKVSGSNEWHTAPAPAIDGLYFPGFSALDANPDLGDSAITETAGVGALAIAAAIPLVKMIGGTAATALNMTREMYEITLTNHPMFTIPVMEFAGTPTGIDAQKVVETGITPYIDTGIAHKQAGVGMIGAGVARIPTACFVQALQCLAPSLAKVEQKS